MNLKISNSFIYVVYIAVSVIFAICDNSTKIEVDPKLSKIWGPGLQPDAITLPARYFFIESKDNNNKTIEEDLGLIYTIEFDGVTNSMKPCRIWTNILNRKDGSYIVRYKLYEPCKNMKLNIYYDGKTHVADSPYIIKNAVYSDDCNCANWLIHEFLESWECGPLPQQIANDLDLFKQINWDNIRKEVVQAFDKPYSISLCHYVIKNNLIHRKCYGKYVGFKMFMDAMLSSLSRKMILPNVEFFVNLGDWPLVTVDSRSNFPIFSWCGSENSRDIVMPTYEITESTLENMGRVMLDMISVQGNVKDVYKNRIPKAFWRGRDSNRHRLDLIDISRNYPDLFNVSLTNFFFFTEEKEKYGSTSERVSFFSFFDYKFQLALDGTVAAYRFPYLLAGGSLIFKQNSQYYEHFYNDLKPNVHYIPVKKDLSDLIEKIHWALKNEEEAEKIAKNGQDFANENLLPRNIFCYYAHLLNEFSTRITSDIKVLENMEQVEPNKQPIYCDCNKKIKDEL